MAFTKLTNVMTSNDVITAIHDFAIANGWTAKLAPTADTEIINHQRVDGLKCCLLSPNGETYVMLRSSNGYPIFKQTARGINFKQWYIDPSHLDQYGNYIPSFPPLDAGLYGIGCTIGSNYSSSANYWFQQDDVPKYATTDNTGDVVGVGLQMSSASSHTVYLNAITGDSPCIIVTIEYGGVFQHMMFGNIKKLGVWTGGAFMSATANSYTMSTLVSGSPGSTALIVEKNMVPIFSTTDVASTFLRIDMDDAPLRGHIVWASSGALGASGASCYTGKQLAMPLRTVGLSGSWVPKVPHYGFLQSQNSTDQGRNANTLNCITTDLTFLLAVIRDPDSLRVFSPVGYIPDVYFISLFNIASASTYEINYPTSGNLHQAFSIGHRGGAFGYDGISIKQ